MNEPNKPLDLLQSNKKAFKQQILLKEEVKFSIKIQTLTRPLWKPQSSFKALWKSKRENLKSQGLKIFGLLGIKVF